MNDAACMNRRIAALERTIAYLERRVKELEEQLQPGVIALTSGISAVGVSDPEFDWTKVEAIQYEDKHVELKEILDEARETYERIKKEPMPGDVIHTLVDEYGNRSYVKVSPKPPDDDESAQSTVVEGPK